MPLALNRRFSNCMNVLSSGLTQVRAVLPSLCRLTLKNATINAKLGTNPNFTRTTTRRVTRVAGLPFIATPGGFAIVNTRSTLIVTDNILGALTISLCGVTGSVHLLDYNPHTKFTRLRLPRGRPKSSVVPKGIGPARYRTLTVTTIRIVNCSTTITFTKTDNCLRVGICGPVVVFGVLRSVQLVTSDDRGFARFLIRKVAPGLGGVHRCISDSLVLIATLDPMVNCSGTSRVTRRTFRRSLALGSTTLTLKFVDTRRFSHTVSPCTVARL